jgi:protein-tyrosine phosphatase
VIPQGAEPQPFTVLLVCTGNICRSAFAERLGRAVLREELGERDGAIHLASAGTRAVVGSAMHPDTALVLRGFGADAGDFVARQFEDSMAAGADLVLTMTRRHRRDVLHAAPRAMARTFTLREAADLLESGGSPDIPEADFRARARSLVGTMAEARARRRGGDDDDIADPIGLPLDGHEAMGQTVTAALLPLLRRLVQLASHSGAGSD